LSILYLQKGYRVLVLFRKAISYKRLAHCCYYVSYCLLNEKQWNDKQWNDKQWNDKQWNDKQWNAYNGMINNGMINNGMINKFEIRLLFFLKL